MSPVLAGTKPLLLGECCAIIITVICRYGGIGRHKGLKILRKKFRIGSSPISGTNPGSIAGRGVLYGMQKPRRGAPWLVCGDALEDIIGV